MASFSHLVRFESEEDGRSYFADLGVDADGPPAPGTGLGAYTSIDDLRNKASVRNVTVRRVSSLTFSFLVQILEAPTI